MWNRIPARDIFDQLRQDLKGKDAYRGVTLSYAWLANQFGHFALGFIPATVGYLLFSNHRKDNWLASLPALAVWALWMMFELWNFISSVNKQGKHPVVEKTGTNIFYHARRWHFWGDLFTDIGFFGLGALLAYVAFAQSLWGVMAAIAVACFLAFASYYWYGAKIYLQRAQYPFQFRLSQWNRDMSQANKDAINQFMEAEFSGMQLLVLGEDDDEKIKLCVGIGSEISYGQKKCRYLTAMKAFECFCREEAKEAADSEKFTWNWQEAALLIIDDINPSHAKLREFITPADFLSMIDQYEGERNRKLLREKKVIWMLGNETPDGAEQRGWEEMLVSIGVSRDNIRTVNLSDGFPS
ncbi:MAG: hypothetical protein JNM88_00675 [Chitinophagaceae bacterium]|nr:hypothetical protein [Chitinophagaceae bacterium]